MKLSKRLTIGIIVVIFITLFLFLNLTGFSKEVKNFFYLISSPIQNSLWQIGDSLSDFFEALSEIKNLKKENEKLKLRIEELLAENVLLKELKKENEFLKQALEIGLEREFKLRLAQVIGKDVSQDLLIIDKGAIHGLSENLPVITQQKTLVGRISQVYKNFSKVLLISNPKSSFNAKISDKEQTSNQILGIVKGKGNLRIFLHRIPQQKEIKEGDLVITAALGGVFPEGLLVGHIKEILRSDVRAFQQAKLEPGFDIRELDHLLIITSL